MKAHNCHIQSTNPQKSEQESKVTIEKTTERISDPCDSKLNSTVQKEKIPERNPVEDDEEEDEETDLGGSDELVVVMMILVSYQINRIWINKSLSYKILLNNLLQYLKSLGRLLSVPKLLKIDGSLGTKYLDLLYVAWS